MYVLIDRQQMAITHKHHNRVALAHICWIECTNAGCSLPIGNLRAWHDFTPQELKKIYKNATGADLEGYFMPGLAQAVDRMARRLPESNINEAEAFEQRKLILDGDKSSYQYLPGSKVPKEHLGLFTPDPLQCERAEPELLLGAQGQHSYTPPAGADNNGSPTPHVPRPPSAPRTGGSRETIYSVADQMWAAAGSPRELHRVLELRKQIMAELEANHQIKKTTSSTALGDWQKLRLS